MKKKNNYQNWPKEKLITRIKNLEKRKKYGLVWEDKPEDVVELYKDKLPIAKEVKNKEIITDKNKPVNLLIEGDNYHALSVLNYTHARKIDVIYIDPPYNTGNKDFVFNDRYVDSVDGYRHSKWVSFMEKRLRLSRNLLKDSGVIFISIDYNSLAQLKLLCDDIFGEKNYIENIIWRKKEGGGQQDGYFVTEHEYILSYARNKDKSSLIEKKAQKTKDAYSLFDRKRKKHYKIMKLAKWGSGALKEDRPTMYFPIKSPDRRNSYPVAPDGRPGRWRYGKINVFKLIDEDAIEWVKKKGKWVPYEKVYEPSENEVKILKQRSIFYDYTTTADGANELTNIFGIKDIFSNPKPTLLIIELLLLTANKKAVVLDFFAGSGTTGQAVLEFNKEDKGSRQFILCTNNEDNNGRGLKIAKDICYPRIRKVIEGYKNLRKEKIEGLGGNLKYFKTAFVEAEPTDKNKRKLTEQATEMLCIREGTFESVVNQKKFKIFKNSSHYTGVIFDQIAILAFKKAIKDIRARFSIYIFSLSDETFNEEFVDIKQKIKLSPIPEAILRVYRRIFR